MADKSSLNLIKITDPTEQSEVQSIALLLDVTYNPIFSAPVIAKGEDYTTPIEGITLPEATKSVGTGVEESDIGPVVIDGTDTEAVIQALLGDISGNFTGSSGIASEDDVRRFFFGEPVVEESRLDLDVCVDNTTDVALPGNPTVSYDQTAFNTALIANLQPPAGGIFNAPFVKAVTGLPPGANQGRMPADFSSGEPEMPDEYNNITHPAGNLARSKYQAAIDTTKRSNPPAPSCPAGSRFESVWPMQKFRYSKPYQLDENITITGLTYTDVNGSGEIIDDQMSVPFTLSYAYSSGAEFSALNTRLTAAGQSALAGKKFDLSVKFVELGSAGAIQPPTTDSKNVIGAISELDANVNTAGAQAGTVEESVWVGGVGDWRNSQIAEIDDPQDAFGTATIPNPNFDTKSLAALIAKNPDWDKQIAWRKLNLIPVLLKDKILASVEYTDEGDPNDPDDDEILTRLELVPESQVNLLEATYTIWRHVSAFSTAAWGISALTDLDIYDDKHQYIEPLKLNSFIQNFNLLYTTIEAVSGDVDLLQHALSGSDPGDTLIEQLSGYSVYMNLNNLYTELSGLSGDVFNNTTNIDNLSAAIDACCADGGNGGGGTDLPCDDICKTLDSIEGPAIDCNYPGGFTVDWPSDDSHYKPYKREDGDYPEVKDTSIIYEFTPLATASPTTVRYLWQANDDTWHIGDAPGETVDTAPNTPLILEGTPIDPVYPDGLLIPGGMGAPLSGAPDPLPPLSEKLCAITECCELIKNYISTTGGDTTIISLSSLVTKNIIDITSLSGCCDTCSATISFNVLIPNHPDPSLSNGTWSRSFEYVVNQTETFTESFMYSSASVAGYAPHSTWQINNVTLTYSDGTIQPVTLRDRTAIPTTQIDANGNLGHNLNFTFDVPCTTTNNSKLLALSAAIYGPTYGDQWDIYFTDPGTGLPGSVITNINKLRYDITQIDIGSPNNQININKTNITTLSGNVDALSACCDLNRTDINILSADILALETHEHDGGVPADHGHPGLSALSAAIYGDDYTDNYYNLNNPDYSVIQQINHLYEAGEDQADHIHLGVAINTTNITSISGDVISLSGDIDALSGCCEANRTDIDILSGHVGDNIYNINTNTTDITNITTDITSVSGDVFNIKGDYVNRTTNQSVSGEKVFKDVLTVSTSANIGDTVTIGGGDTVFNVCVEENGATTMVINNLQTDPAQVPTNGVYIVDINGTKILAIKV